MQQTTSDLLSSATTASQDVDHDFQATDEPGASNV